MDDPDHLLRLSALKRARELQQVFDDIVPRAVLLDGFTHKGQDVSFGSFQKGIHRAKEQQGPAALTLLTAAPKPGHEPPYDDTFDEASGQIRYHYRAGSIDQADNRALRAAASLMAPLIYFKGIEPGQYQVVAPVFVIADDPVGGTVILEAGLPKDTGGEGLISSPETRRYQLTMVARRYHQARFRRDVLRAYRGRCAVCSLREADLLEASHIVRDSEPEGIAAVVNGLALCAIHHRAYDRNLMGIDPRGTVQISGRLLKEIDGPMLGNGLQGFHGAEILQPRRPEQRPEPHRLEARYEEFLQAA